MKSNPEADAEVQALLERLRQPRPPAPEEPRETWQVPDSDWRTPHGGFDPDRDLTIRPDPPSRISGDW